MKTPQHLLFILCIALSCVTSAAGLIRVSGYEGREVNVSCPYKEGYESYEKYLCKNYCDYDDVLIKTTRGKKNRYSIYDDRKKQIFTATISDLSLVDAGKYWCGVTRNGKDIYTEVKLNVVPGPEWCCVKSNKLSGIVGRPVTLQCSYPPQHRDNRKFLCKGDHRNKCTDMVTSQSRFTLQPDVPSSSFSVTIAELKAGDAATYWCGSDSQWSVGNYTKIQLSVDVAPTHTMVYILPATLAVLAILAVALVMVYKYKCYKVQGAEVSMNRNTTNTAEAGEMKCVDQIYGNQDVAAEDIYCNYNVIKYNRAKTN